MIIMQAIILAGGFGTRLQSVISDTPKVMAPVRGKPFLAFILDYLEQADKEIRAAILVAGYHENIENPFKKLNNTFIGKKFNWNKIAENCEEFIVIGSDNDEYIPEDVTRRLAFKLDAELHIIHNGGHLNADAGYKKFPFLLQLIERLHNNESY